MKAVSTRPLEELRRAVAGLRSEAALRRWSRLLLADGRSGARELGEHCARRARERASRRRHLQRLLERREALQAAGVRVVAGVDEVGMGPLAGPVVAAAVVLPEQVEFEALERLDDSKQLSAPLRERLAGTLHLQSRGIGIGEVWPEEIDRLDIYRAGLEAMRRAVLALPDGCTPGHVLVDARTIPELDCEQTPIVGGDGLDASIAAASVVAKVHRDSIMRKLDALYGAYGFARHMGYATEEHLAALREFGPSPVHRRSFAPVAEALRG